MSSSTFLRSCLLKTGWPDDPIATLAEDTLREICRVRVAHARRFQSGHFSDFASWTGGNYETLDKDPGKDPQFYGDHLGWIDCPTRTSVTLCNLRTGRIRSFRSEGRQQISHMGLSHQLVAFMTYSGMCYACDIQTQEKRSFRLPGSHELLVCQERYVGGSFKEAPNKTSVFVWNFDDARCRTFLVPAARYVQTRAA